MHLTIADWIGIISFLVAIELAIGHGTVSLSNAVPEKWVPRVQAWCNILAFVGSSMVAVLSRMAVVAIVAVLVLGAGQAMAQDRGAGAKIRLPIPNPLNLGGAPNATNGANVSDQLGALLAKPFQDLADFIANDLSAAIALSTAIPALQDGHGQQCFMAMQAFGDVVKAHPIPVTFRAATDLEALRLAQMAANNLCGNPHCTQVFADLATTVQTAAPVNVSIPIPSLHDLCSKVPQIAVVAPAPAAPATPASTAPVPPTVK